MSTSTDLPTRHTIPQRATLDPTWTWDLHDIFVSDDAWEESFLTVTSSLKDIPSYQGALGHSHDALLGWLRFRDRLETDLGLLSHYANRKSDEDTRVNTYQAMVDRVRMLESEYAAAVAWVLPELLAIPAGTLHTRITEGPDLAAYAHHLDDIQRMRPHTLSPKEEELLARSREATANAPIVFGMFNDADITFGTIDDADGNPVEVTKGRYLSLQESPDRRVREAAFRALYGAYDQWKNTLAALLSGQVKRSIFYARSRVFSSSRSAALFEDAIPLDVYDTLIKTIREHLDPLHRSIRLRKKVLGLETVRPWDLHVPLAPEVSQIYSFEEARQMVMDSLGPLGDRYRRDAQQAFADRWIDVYETAGKSSGAYSAWTYGTHPYILLNYNGTLKDVFTLAHELGHAMHSWYTWKSQPPVYGGYSIFCAEVASTCNEMLLMHHLSSQLRDKAVRLDLLMHYIETIRGTMYNQALFAEFEMMVHREVEEGGALTAEFLSACMESLYRHYYGQDFSPDPLFARNWSRIPHFYRNFYVFQYATGLSAATALAKALLRGEDGAVQRYLTFLASGSSGYSIDLLRNAGVDMTTPRPVVATAELMSELLDEVEQLL